MLILSGGEPLVREDLRRDRAYASSRGATVVVGTNGTTLTEPRVAMLKEAGGLGRGGERRLARRGGTHDLFRGGAHALERTIEALARLREHRLDFVVQTTATPGQRRRDPRARRLGGRAREPSASTSTSWCPPAAASSSWTSRRRGSRRSSASLAGEESRHRGSMMVRAKCAPHFMRHVHQADPDSPVLSYRTRCPCGIDYCRITPDGKLTPCPYMPTVAGDLRAPVVRGDLVGLARVRRPASPRARRPLRPLRVPHGLRRLPRPRPRHERRLPRRGSLAASTSRRATVRSSHAGPSPTAARPPPPPWLDRGRSSAHGAHPLVRPGRRDAESRGVRPLPGPRHRDARSCSARSVAPCRSTSRRGGRSS